MYFIYTKTIKKNTTEENPDTIDILPLAWGIIHEIKVFFPPGCRNYAHVKLLDGLHQVFPTNTSGNCAADGETVGGIEWYSMERPGACLFLYAWNTSTSYDHTVTIRIGVIPREILLPLHTELGTLNTFMSMFRRRD